MASLHLVLGELGLEVSSANVVSVQGGLRALIPFEQNIRAPNLDNGVSYELFYKWYVLNTQSGHYKGNNALLVKRASAVDCRLYEASATRCAAQLPPPPPPPSARTVGEKSR